MSLEKPEETGSLARKRDKSSRRHPSFWKNAREYFSEYTRATSLNGFLYLGEQKRPKFERILWLVIVSVSVGACVFLISETYQKWENTPVIVSFSHDPMPVWKVPFPAVTICPETKWRQTVYNYTKHFHQFINDRANLTDSESKLFGDASLLCEFDFNGNLTTDEDFFQFMKKSAPSIEKVMIGCSAPTFRGECEINFSTVITEDGLCYSFNALARDDMYTSKVYHSEVFENHRNNVTDWTIEKGYSKPASPKAYPRRTMSAGAEGGLSVLLLAIEKDLDYMCGGPIQGFKVHLHHPAEIPRMSMRYFRVPFDEDVTAEVKPDVVKTSPSLRNYDPHKRGCYFSNEKQLRYYKNYTQQNCLMECLADLTLRECDCVSFYMPRQNSTSICGVGSRKCVKGVKYKILIEDSMREVNGSMTNVDCDCLPSCTTLTYNAETSLTDYDFRTYLKIRVPDRNLDNLAGVKMSKLNIYFKEMQFMTSERNELYGSTDFLANCGGLLGLFIGFSLISLLETVWFLTGRLWINWRKYGRHYWSASDDLLQNEIYGYQKQSV